MATLHDRWVLWTSAEAKKSTFEPVGRRTDDLNSCLGAFVRHPFRRMVSLRRALTKPFRPLETCTLGAGCAGKGSRVVPVAPCWLLAPLTDVDAASSPHLSALVLRVSINSYVARRSILSMKNKKWWGHHQLTAVRCSSTFFAGTVFFFFVEADFCSS